MKENTLLTKLRSGPAVLGYASSYPHPGAIQFGCRGWDLLWMCSQHGHYTYDNTYSCLLAAESLGINTMIRVPGHEPDYLSRILDLAPDAVMIPLVNTAEQARAIARIATYPPHGVRSFGGPRNLAVVGDDFYKKTYPLIITQIESEEGVRNAEEIINTPGVDMLFFSPDDMRLSMGIPFEIGVEDHPVLRQHLHTVAQACHEAGKLCGVVAVTDALQKLCIEEGYRMIVCAGDTFFLRHSLPFAQETRSRMAGYEKA